MGVADRSPGVIVAVAVVVRTGSITTLVLGLGRTLAVELVVAVGSVGVAVGNVAVGRAASAVDVGLGWGAFSTPAEGWPCTQVVLPSGIRA